MTFPLIQSNEHLPECPINIGNMSVTIDGKSSTIFYYCACSVIEACERRVLGEGIQKLLTEEGVRGFIEYGKSRWNKGYEMGYEVAKAKYKKGKK